MVLHLSVVSFQAFCAHHCKDGFYTTPALPVVIRLFCFNSLSLSLYSSSLYSSKLPLGTGQPLSSTLYLFVFFLNTMHWLWGPCRRRQHVCQCAYEVKARHFRPARLAGEPVLPMEYASCSQLHVPLRPVLLGSCDLWRCSKQSSCHLSDAGV